MSQRAQPAAVKSGSRGGAVAAALLALVLAACDHYHWWETRQLDNATALGLSEPQVPHPMPFAARRETLDIEVPPDAEGLSPDQHIDVVRFLEEQTHEAKRRLVVFVPTPQRSAGAIARTLQDIQRHIVDAQVTYRVVKMTAWERGHTALASIRLAYERPVAVAPTCGDWSEDVGRKAERVADPNGDCATQRPWTVLVDPAREEPRASEKRAQTWSTSMSTAAKSGAVDARAPGKTGAPSAAKP
ncbi:MAG TPA: CpaD family pilus assembly lipoprotein [Hyphomicrobiaceae bacterium]|jgi:pilus biogenesis lipoprotein CpaD|nr:CpaD family pilus assembly lipoprotein [Hyphomicrobiaceae bacterium]